MFQNIKILIINLLTVGKHLFKKPVTLEYPEKKKEVGKYFRGKPVVDGCIGCMTCTKVCPSGAISVIKSVPDNENSTEQCQTPLMVKRVEIDLKKCIFCGNCSFYCPKGAIQLVKEYELASSDKKDLKLVYEMDRREK